MLRLIPFRFFCRCAVALPLLAGLARADEGEIFADGSNGALVHSASGFVCPMKIGVFERDAAGRRDPESEADYCAYSALRGVYATIVILPLPATFDPKESLKREFAVQEGTGGTVVGDIVEPLGNGEDSLPVYRRTYENARLESLHYRTLFATAAIGAWNVQVILEFAHPRDDKLQTDVLSSIYAAARRQIVGSGSP